MQKTYPEIYKQDSGGKIRVWYMEQDGDKFRTFDGQVGGKIKASGWRVAKPTNVGRSNERTGVVQATFTIEAKYEKQLKTEYHETVEDTAKGPHYFMPMLAEKYEEFTSGDAQPKLDGFRCINEDDGAWSREGEPLAGAAHIVEALREVMARKPDLVFDGELYNHELRHDFGKLSGLIKRGWKKPEDEALAREKIQYHVYDLPSIKAPFRERSAILKKLVAAINNPSIIYVETVGVDSAWFYDECHDRWLADGYEGSMLRNSDSEYQTGKRTKDLLKRKEFDDAEFDIIPGGIQEGEGNWDGCAKRVVCWLPDADRTIDLNDKKAREANTFEAGIDGDKDQNRKLLAEADQHEVVTIRHFGWTSSEIPKPRFGVAKQFHGSGRTL